MPARPPDDSYWPGNTPKTNAALLPAGTTTCPTCRRSLGWLAGATWVCPAPHAGRVFVILLDPQHTHGHTQPEE